jgi:hypothetical protein
MLDMRITWGIVNTGSYRLNLQLPFNQLHNIHMAQGRGRSIWILQFICLEVAFWSNFEPVLVKLLKTRLSFTVL